MELSAIARHGMETAQSRIEGTARRVSRAAAAPDAGADTVDLSREMAALLAARNDFAANARVLKTAEEIERRAISLLG